jgi:hypothetical protein
MAQDLSHSGIRSKERKLAHGRIIGGAECNRAIELPDWSVIAA